MQPGITPRREIDTLVHLARRVMCDALPDQNVFFCFVFPTNPNSNPFFVVVSTNPNPNPTLHALVRQSVTHTPCEVDQRIYFTAWRDTGLCRDTWSLSKVLKAFL